LLGAFFVHQVYCFTPNFSAKPGNEALKQALN